MANANRKAEIIASAIDLFRQKGFASVSTRDLADHAGLSRSHIYHYFNDWEQLRREAFEAFTKDQLDEAESGALGVSPIDALSTFLQDCLPSSPDEPWALWLDAWDEALHDAELAELYLGVNGRFHAILEGIIRRGVEEGVFRCAAPERASRQLFALVMGQSNDLLLSPSSAATDLAMSETMEVAGFLLGFTPDGAAV
jgi:AcrR family transcriptional regulator